MRYAEFIHTNASYVVSATLERLFNKDAEFQEYLAKWKPSQSADHSEGEGEEKALRIEPVALTRK